MDGKGKLPVLLFRVYVADGERERTRSLWICCVCYFPDAHGECSEFSDAIPYTHWCCKKSRKWVKWGKLVIFGEKYVAGKWEL